MNNEELMVTIVHAEKEYNPSDADCIAYLKENPLHSFYSAKEELRNRHLLGLPPDGYKSWGNYWASY